MYKAKHYNNKIKVFGKSYGKHSKQKLIIYNPIYTKFSAYISSLAITTSFFACATFAKYRSTFALATNQRGRTAKYILNLSGDENTISNFIPNTTRSINFEVKNFEGLISSPTDTSDVSLKYCVSISYEGEAQLPLQYSLYRITHRNNEEISTQIPLVNNKTDWINVANISELHEYRLDITWPLNEGNSYIYSNIEDNVIITTEFEQSDS